MEGIFAQTFHRAQSFPLWFAVIAVASMSGSIINARLVMKLGMRAMIAVTYAVLLAVTLAYLALTATEALGPDAAFAAHVLWSIVLFAAMGLTLGNLNALAMEPLGHVAGMAASITSAIATVASVILAVPVGLIFDGTTLPLLIGVAGYGVLALALSLMLRVRT
jgi:DHA1 family bicyclomycin/chloramphenicol resistance-like MFS transporter